MAHKVSNGFIAPSRDDYEYTVNKSKKSGGYKYFNPTGVYIHGSQIGVYMDYAGINNSPFHSFQLPTDPDFLRDIGEAIIMMADTLPKL